MSYCVCDYERPSVYSVTQVSAAKARHQCSECFRVIHPGEPYERTYGIWGGSPDTFKTCQHCTALRDWVKAHVPCACIEHGNMREGLLYTAESWSTQAPGLWFGALRREVLILKASGGRAS